VQTKIHQAVDRHAGNANRSAEAGGAAEAIRRPQVQERSFANNHSETNTEAQSY
jgi:hypothetical protein